MKKSYLYSAIIALAVSLSTLGIAHYFEKPNKSITIEHIDRVPSSQTALNSVDNTRTAPLDFTETAENVVNSVVHIKSTQIYAGSDYYHGSPENIPSPFRDFFGDGFEDFFGRKFRFETPNNRMETPPTKVGSGSVD